jgi:hypothetical protein
MCQQLRPNTCQRLPGLPIVLGIENFFAEIALDENNRFSLGVYASDTCTGAVMGITVSLEGMRLDRCTPFIAPGFGQVLDFAVHKECELCVPDAGLATNMSVSLPATTPTTPVSTISQPASTTTGIPESQVPAGAKSSSKGVPTAAVAAGVAVPLAIICVLIVVVIARRQRGTHVPLKKSPNDENPSFGTDPEAGPSMSGEDRNSAHVESQI